jgi:serine/threonine-protein kinase
VGQDLEALVLACLAKRPSDRPATARELCERLARCEVESAWTREDAEQWWETRLEPDTAVTFSD